MKEYTSMWWLFLIRGIVAVIIGLLAFAYPVKTITLLTILVGLFFLIDAVIMAIVSLFSIKSNDKWWVLLLQAGLVLLLGIFVFNYPELTIKILFLAVTFWLIVSGVITIVMSIVTRKEGYGGWLMAGLGIVLIIFALIMLGNPETTLTLFVILFGIMTLVSGVMNIALSFEMKRIGSDIKKLK